MIVCNNNNKCNKNRWKKKKNKIAASTGQVKLQKIKLRKNVYANNKCVLYYINNDRMQ
jgi:hypothetical protein